MEVTAIIEDPRGSTVRHFYDDRSGEWISKPHRHSSTPWPANYGYIPDTWNQSDGDDLDVLVISQHTLSTGDEVTARVVGLLRRPDGDDKIVGVLVGDPHYERVARLADLRHDEIEAIKSWFAEWSEVGEWREVEDAVERVRQARIDSQDKRTEPNE